MSPLEPDTIFDRYKIVRTLGQGGMGAVYEAVHLPLKRRVALKVLLPRVSARAGAKERFLREGEIVARLKHPHIVTVLDLGFVADSPFLVMELLDGEDMERLIERGGALASHAAVDLLLPVCAAIAYAHAKGVVHRDLKPANVFLARSEADEVTPMLMDFGIAKASDLLAPALTATADMIGSPLYMSPEQFRQSRSVEAASDQYSLCVILYQCVTARLPFEADSALGVYYRIQSGSPPSVRSLRPDLPARLDEVIRRGLSLAPSDRFSSVLALGAALLPFASPAARQRWASTFDGPGAVDPLSPTANAPTPAAPDPRPSSMSPAIVAPSAMPLTSGATRSSRPFSVAARVAAFLAVVGAGGAAAARLIAPRIAQSEARPSEQPPAAHTPPPPPPRVAARYHVSLRVAPSNSEILLDGRRAGSGTLEQDLEVNGAPHVLVVSAPGYLPGRLEFVDQPPASTLALTPMPAPPPAPASAAVSHVAPERPPARARRRQSTVRRRANGALDID